MPFSNPFVFQFSCKSKRSVESFEPETWEYPPIQRKGVLTNHYLTYRIVFSLEQPRQPALGGGSLRSAAQRSGAQRSRRRVGGPAGRLKCSLALQWFGILNLVVSVLGPKQKTFAGGGAGLKRRRSVKRIARTLGADLIYYLGGGSS